MESSNSISTAWDTHAYARGNTRMSFQADLPVSGDYPLFVEMAQLAKNKGLREEWREAARWVKYEEAIDEGGKRWSKPYVSAVKASALNDLKRVLEDSEFHLGITCENEEKLCRHLVETWVSEGTFPENERGKILQTMLRPHVHLYETAPSLVASLFKSSKKNKNQLSAPNLAARRGSILSVVYEPQKKDDSEKNQNFMRKLPRNAECANILVGTLPMLSKPVAAFVRIKEPDVLGNFTEVPLPTRFVFVLLAPEGMNYMEIGRAMGTVLTDPGFRAMVYRAQSKETVLKGIDEFLQTTSVLPSAVWDPSIRLEPPAKEDSHGHGGGDDSEHGDAPPPDDGLTRTGIPFGGFINDLKRKIPWYPSDFRDAFSLQVLATWMFLYFACLTPMITFGGLMGEATHSMMGTMETMVAGCVCGIVFALFSGQPLTILGSTGPMLVFEKILVSFTESNNLKYLEFRLWVGVWVAAILLIIVATDASALVKYITRFTEDNFATLIALIFMYEAIKNVIHIAHEDPKLEFEPDLNFTLEGEFDSEANQTIYDMRHEWVSATEKSAFLMSLLLFFGTFFVSYMLKAFRLSSFCPTWFRYLISDFAVIFAILIMTMIDYLAGVVTPKLNVPAKFAPTSDERGWFISPFDANPLWSVFAAIVPAILAAILIFMDQQITAVIVNRKDHKLQKGCGYHLDLFVLLILILVGSFFGLPWFVAATVESLTNVGSLKMESETAAPGEKPTFLGVREQRLSNLLVFITVGLSVLLTTVLKNVPMPVLYGVFLYMGFSALMRMELFHRILLLFMPTKYQPDHSFLRQVPLRRVHLFTLIQVVCLAVLWIIKSIKTTAIGFPLMLVVMMVVRKLLEYIFTDKELLALDDPLPGSGSKSKKDDGDEEKAIGNGKGNHHHSNGKKPSVAIIVTS